MSTLRHELLIFDWDGTVLDSIGTIVACTRQTLRELNLPVPSTRRIRSAIGLGLRDTVMHIHPGCDEKDFQDILRVYRRLWIGDYGNRPETVPGALETMDALVARGHRMAVATAKGREGLERDFDRTELRRYFSTSRTINEAPGKPDPEMALGILQELDADPRATLVIGDSVHDMGMAANAHIDAVGVATGSESPESLIAAGALVCLASITELPEWLDSLPDACGGAAPADGASD